MKHMRLIKSLLVLLLIAVGVNMASAQSVKFSIDKTFLTPGERASITVNMTSDIDLTAFSGMVELPDGLSFIPNKNGTKYIGAATNPECDFLLTPAGSSKAKAGFMVTNLSTQKPTKGAFFTFDVMVAEDFVPHANIKLTELIAAIANGGVVTEVVDDDLVADVYNVNRKIEPTIADITIAPGETKTVEFVLNQEGLSCLEYRLALPAGLTISNYKISETRTPEHKIKAAGDYVAIFPVFTADNYNILGKEGAIFTFDVTATEELAENSEISIRNILATAATDPVDEYFGADFKVKVTKGGIATGINGIESDFAAKADGIYTISGLKVNKLVKGVNIVVKDGKATKVVKK